jgi:hypothetical protein
VALREVVWVILDQFERLSSVVVVTCGHVGNALALSIMSTAMLDVRGAICDEGPCLRRSINREHHEQWCKCPEAAIGPAACR